MTTWETSCQLVQNPVKVSEGLSLDWEKWSWEMKWGVVDRRIRGVRGMTPRARSLLFHLFAPA